MRPSMNPQLEEQAGHDGLRRSDHHHTILLDSSNRSGDPPSIQKSMGDLLKAHHHHQKEKKKKSQTSQLVDISTSTSQSPHQSEKKNDDTTAIKSNPFSYNNNKKRAQLDHHHRSNKHSPMIMSSKIPITRKRSIVQQQEQLPKLERRDPRFDSCSGTLQPQLYQRSYGFLKTLQETELDQLRHAYNTIKTRKNRSTDQRHRHHDDDDLLVVELEKKIQLALQRAENVKVENHKLEQEREALKNWKMKEKIEQQQNGKRAFYLKKRHQKDIILANRFEYLSKDKKKLNKAIERKKKKVAGKEKKSIPFKRQTSLGS